MCFTQETKWPPFGRRYIQMHFPIFFLFEMIFRWCMSIVFRWYRYLGMIINRNA